MAEPIVAEVSESGAALAYQVQRPLEIPSDGSPHKTTIARFELDAVLDHLAVPIQALEAYLRATVTNDSKLLLLPGPARVFHDGQFVGETSLETVAAGEEFELQLGVDDQIRVERELRRRSTAKAVLGGSRTVDIAYEITVENHRSGKARLSVHDHIPLSSDGEIKVRLRETSPNPAEQTELGELIWKFELDPGKSAKLTHRFTVEHPAAVTVTGLNDGPLTLLLGRADQDFIDGDVAGTSHDVADRVGDVAGLHPDGVLAAHRLDNLRPVVTQQLGRGRTRLNQRYPHVPLSQLLAHRLAEGADAMLGQRVDPVAKPGVPACDRADVHHVGDRARAVLGGADQMRQRRKCAVQQPEHVEPDHPLPLDIGASTPGRAASRPRC